MLLFRNIIDMRTILAISLMLPAAALLPAVPALAQSGSRICGWTAATPGGAIGILYEARQDDASYSRQCDDAVSKIKSKIDSDAKLNTLTWSKKYKETCESVGALFISGNNPGSDICDKMEAKAGYTVQLSKSAGTTTFTKD
jgi:hypothetical protein